MAWLGNWSKRIKLTIDHGDIDDALSDFPILVYLSTSSGRNSKDVSCIFDELTEDANRKKIAITTSDGVTQCYVEIEKWDDANEKAWLWVKVPSVASGADTDIYLYYDKTHADNATYVGDTNSTPAENVWPDGYFITHMKDDPDNAHIRDSSGYSSDGDKAAANQPQGVAGDKTAYAQDFNSANPDYIEIPAGHTQLNFTTHDFSMIVRVRVEDLTAQRELITRGSLLVDGYYWYIVSTGRVYFRTNQDGVIQTTNSAIGDITANTWHTVGMSRDGASVRLYADGVDINEVSGNHLDPANCIRSAKIGIYEDKIIHPFDGKIEFLGVFGGVALTPAFHKAFDQSITDDLLDFGSEERELPLILEIGQPIIQAKKLGSQHIASGAIISDLIAVLAVGTQHIADEAVTSAKLASGQVGIPHIYPNAITSGKVASGAIVLGMLGGGARVYRTAVQSIPDDTLTFVEFDAERYDTEAIHDNTTNPARLTCKVAGVYVITASIGFAANAVGTRFAEIHHSGEGAYICSLRIPAYTEAGHYTHLCISTVHYLAVDDYVRVAVIQDSGDALDLLAFANCSEFAMQRIG